MDDGDERSENDSSKKTRNEKNDERGGRSQRVENRENDDAVQRIADRARFGPPHGDAQKGVSGEEQFGIEASVPDFRRDVPGSHEEEKVNAESDREHCLIERVRLEIEPRDRAEFRKEQVPDGEKEHVVQHHEGDLRYESPPVFGIGKEIRENQSEIVFHAFEIIRRSRRGGGKNGNTKTKRAPRARPAKKP